MIRSTRALVFAALAANVVGCAHDTSQILTLRHASQSARHEIPPQSKMRVKLDDGSEFKGFYLGRDQATLRFARLNDGSRVPISMDDVVKIRYRANRTKEGAGRGFRKGALWGSVTLGGYLFIVAPALSNERNARLTGVVYGSTMGGVVGGLWGALLGAVYHARYKPPIDVLIDADAWQIEPLR